MPLSLMLLFCVVIIVVIVSVVAVLILTNTCQCQRYAPVVIVIVGVVRIIVVNFCVVCVSVDGGVGVDILACRLQTLLLSDHFLCGRDGGGAVLLLPDRLLCGGDVRGAAAGLSPWHTQWAWGREADRPLQPTRGVGVTCCPQPPCLDFGCTQ